MSETSDKIEFSTGAKRSQRMRRYDLVPKVFKDRVADRFTGEVNDFGPTGGAYKYGESNWERGLPTSDVINHIYAHLDNYVEKFRASLAAGIKDGLEGNELMEAVRKEMISHSLKDDDLAGAAWGISVLMHQEGTGMFHDDGFPLRPVKQEKIVFQQFKKEELANIERCTECLQKFVHSPVYSYINSTIPNADKVRVPFCSNKCIYNFEQRQATIKTQ